jgi:uncharacterized protein YdhG (YjbR/CyaY superfamily)
MTKRSVAVDEYILGVSEESQAVMQELRQNVFDILPDVEELIYYNMPTFKYNGQPFMVYAEFKNHLSLITMRHSIPEKLKAELKGSKVTGTTIHFSAKKPISRELLEKIIAERLVEV